MANSSAYKNENYQSDTSSMIKTSQTTLARLRPQKLDDAAIKHQISLIQQACGPIDVDLIAMIFHECDYNLQNTVARIRDGAAVEDGGWQTAKANSKKKVNQQSNSNGPMQTNETDRVTNQQVSPTASRSTNPTHRRLNPTASRGHPNRRGGRGIGITAPSTRFSNRQISKSKLATSTEQSVTIDENLIVDGQKSPNSSLNDEFEFLAGATQSLTFDNSSKKIPVSAKRPIPSSIPQKPVAMHPTVQYCSGPLDIQFGDVQWNDSIPIAVSPSRTENEIQGSSNLEQEMIHSHENQSYQVTTIPESEGLETSVPNNEDISHPSDSLNDTAGGDQRPILSTSGNLSSSLPSMPASNTTTPAPIPSTGTPVDYSSPTSQPNINPLVINNLQSHANLNGYLSAFTPYNAAQNTYPSTHRDYSSSKSSWTASATTPAGPYKTVPTSTMAPIGPAYAQPQPAFTVANQQQYLLGTYPYPTQVYQVLTPMDSWSPAGYPPTVDSYRTYPSFYPTYSTPQPYHPPAVPTTKYNQYSTYERDANLTYGQARSSSNDLTNTSQPAKDVSTTSTLSATAAAFSQGSPMTTANTTGTFIINPVHYSMPPYIPLASIDSRDNRSGAPYGSQTNRISYQQQRFHHPHSSWQSQQ